MTDNYDSFNFDHYELIPRQDFLRRPITDQYVLFNSKPLTQLNNSQKTEDNKTESQREDYQKLLVQKDKVIQQLKIQVDTYQKLLKAEKQLNRKFQNTFQEIKSFLNKPFLQNQDILEQIKSLIQKEIRIQCKCGKNGGNFKEFQEKIRKREQQIRQLKAKLLQSTANNIYTIFNTQINQQNGIFKQISQLKQQLHKNTSPFPLIQCRHDQKIKNLVKKYEEMLQLYHKNQKIMYQLKNRQQQHFAYFSTLRVQLSSQMQQTCSGYMNDKIIRLENQIQNILQTIKNMPEKVKAQNSQEVKYKQLVNEVQKLKERLTMREIQIQKIRLSNIQLIQKSRILQRNQKQIKNLSELQQKIKQKDKRISQLQITIIEHIDSKIRSQSINSQQEDVQKLRNSVRNLKAVIINLKQQNIANKQKVKQLQYTNKQLKKTLQNISTSLQENSRFVERVNKDGASFKVIQDIIGVLINIAQSQKKCKCLEKTADCLINLNDQYPQLEEILEGLGVMQKTSNLIPMQD